MNQFTKLKSQAVKALTSTVNGKKSKKKKPRTKLSEFFRLSPLASIDLTRDKSLPRKGIKL